jgi:hypothetical protein
LELVRYQSHKKAKSSLIFQSLSLFWLFIFRLEINKEYSLENIEIFLIKNANFDFIAKACCSSGITNLKIRLNLWRVLLKIIPLENIFEIKEKIESSRCFYYKQFENFKPQKNIKDDPLFSNPLSKTTNVDYN